MGIAPFEGEHGGFMKIMTSILFSLCLSAPALAVANKWKPVQPDQAALAPLLVAKVKVDSRSYALYRDPQTQACFMVHKSRKTPVSEEQVKSIRSQAVNLAWKIRYQAKHAANAKAVNACQAPAGEVMVPATDDAVRICRADRASVKEAQLLSSNFNKILAVKVAKR